MKMTCSTCQKPKATLECGICHDSLCKSCTQFMDEETFAYLLKIPADLSHQTYCITCYDSKVAPELSAYNDDMEKAKGIVVFSTKETKITRHIRRLEDPIAVKDCLDEKEATMRLAFLAVRANHNVLIDFDVSYDKIRNGSYQKLMWKAQALPVTVDVDKLPKDRSNS